MKVPLAAGFLCIPSLRRFNSTTMDAPTITTWIKVAGFLGDAIILITFLRVFMGVTIVAQSILWGMGVVAVVIGLVVYLEKKVPSSGVARLKRGGLIFLSTLLVDLVVHVIVK